MDVKLTTGARDKSVGNPLRQLEIVSRGRGSEIMKLRRVPEQARDTLPLQTENLNDGEPYN